MSGEETAPASHLVDHLVNCRQVDAALVVEGSADGVIASLIAAGWEYLDEEKVAGKRIRYLRPPGEST